VTFTRGWAVAEDAPAGLPRRAPQVIVVGRSRVAYYATGTAHAPHHAPPEWIAKFKGQFDQGWDKVREETFARQKALGIIPADAKLTVRSEGIPAWDSLNADQKKVFAHMMEVYCAALAHADNQMASVRSSAR
jgi:arylsulfatase A-like enzyme